MEMDGIFIKHPKHTGHDLYNIAVGAIAISAIVFSVFVLPNLIN